MYNNQPEWSRRQSTPIPLGSWTVLPLLLTVILLVVPRSFAADRILVLSAASAGPAITEIASDFSRTTGLDVRVAIGSSGTLARQIQQGAPADIYVSASMDWIETLTGESHLSSQYTGPLLRNRLVMISPTTVQPGALLDLSKPVDLLSRLSSGRLAIGDPAHVPAGHYARQAIENLGLWPAVRDRLARQTNVRAVLALVERGEAPLGIVYATDLALSNSVKIAAIVPASSHDPITYGVAILRDRDHSGAVQFYNALNMDTAEAVFSKFGFGLVKNSTETTMQERMRQTERNTEAHQLSRILPSIP